MMPTITRLENFLPIPLARMKPGCRGLHNLTFKVHYKGNDEPTIATLVSGQLDQYTDVVLAEDKTSAVLTFSQVPSSLLRDLSYLDPNTEIKQPFVMDFLLTVTIEEGHVNANKGAVDFTFTNEEPDLSEIDSIEFAGVQLWVNDLNDDQAAESDAGVEEGDV